MDNHPSHSFSGVVDQLRKNALTAEQTEVVRLIAMELAVWKAGVVMGRDTWIRNTSVLVYIRVVYETLYNELSFCYIQRIICNLLYHFMLM
ncbi:hypothetical protein Hanom_Chr05g00387881 [Helianthus anomalus]